MKRVLAAGALAAVLIAPLGACGSGSDQTASGRAASVDAVTSASPSTAPSPGDLLAAAAAKLDGQSVRFTLDDGSAQLTTGGFDAATGGSLLTGRSDGETIETVVLGNDMYLGGIDPSGRWLHVLITRLPADSPFLVIVDPLFGRKFLTAAADVKQARPGVFTGTLNLTTVSATGAAKQLADNLAKSAGATATAVPFTATVDSQGRLSGFKATFPAADPTATTGAELKFDLKILEYGATVRVAAPPKNQTVEAPPSTYTS